MKLLISVFLFGLMGFGYNSFATESACKADREKFCKGVEMGQGRLMKCMDEHASELSEGCKKFMNERTEKRSQRKQKIEKMISLCELDFVKFCKDAKKGQGRKWKCLLEHEDELSSQCKEVVHRKR